MIKDLKKDPIDLTFSWLIFAISIFLSSCLIIPFLLGIISLQDHSEIFLASLVFLVDSVVFFPPFQLPKFLKFLVIGLNFILLN